MPLNFAGDDQWVVYKKDYHSGHRTQAEAHVLNISSQLRSQVDARRTTEGTYPPGSMWTANPILPYQVTLYLVIVIRFHFNSFGKDFDYFTQEEGGSHDTGHGDIIDKV